VRAILSRAYRRLRRLLQPTEVAIAVPPFFEYQTPLRLTTAHGRDHIALRLFQHGWNGFEAPVPTVISAAAMISEGSFFDVGANTGLYSLLVAKAAKSKIVHAFEPYETVAKVFAKNINLNDLDGRIKVNISALADEPGEKKLYIPLQYHGGLESSSSLNPGFKPAHSRVLEVPVTTIDHYTGQVDAGRLGFLKIDVESTEHQVLAGATQTIARDRPLIVLEVLHLADHAWLDGFCKEHDYKIFTLHPDCIKMRDQVEFTMGAWNQCFCPSEKLHILLEIAQTAGLKYE